MITELEVDKYYLRPLTPYSDVDVFVGSYEVLGNVVPGVMEDGKFVVKTQVKAPEKCLVYIELRQQVVAERGDHVLLMNPGLQAREFRIIGGGRITETNSKLEFFSKKTKEGTVGQKREANEYSVNGLFSTSEAASKFMGKQVCYCIRSYRRNQGFTVTKRSLSQVQRTSARRRKSISLHLIRS